MAKKSNRKVKSSFKGKPPKGPGSNVPTYAPKGMSLKGFQGWLGIYNRSMPLSPKIEPK